MSDSVSGLPANWSESDSPPKELSEAVGLVMALMTLVRAIKSKAGYGAIEGISLAPRQLQVLMQLYLHERMTVSEIAEGSGSSLASTSLVVSQLSQQDLLVRQEDSEDHRRTIVRPGPQFHQFVTSVLLEHLRPLVASLAAMDGADRRELVRLVGCLKEQLGTRSEGD